MLSGQGAEMTYISTTYVWPFSIESKFDTVRRSYWKKLGHLPF